MDYILHLMHGSVNHKNESVRQSSHQWEELQLFYLQPLKY